MKASVLRRFTFCAGHRLMNHDGKCRCPHGHTYGLTVAVGGEVSTREKTSSNGMVIDFSHLKTVVSSVIDILDHAMILEEGDPLIPALIAEKHHKVVVLGYAPTAENLAIAVTCTLIDLFDIVPDTLRVMVSETDETEAAFNSDHLGMESAWSPLAVRDDILARSLLTGATIYDSRKTEVPDGSERKT